jgi:hypothetical protein
VSGHVHDNSHVAALTGNARAATPWQHRSAMGPARCRGVDHIIRVPGNHDSDRHLAGVPLSKRTSPRIVLSRSLASVPGSTALVLTAELLWTHIFIAPPEGTRVRATSSCSIIDEPWLRPNSELICGATSYTMERSEEENVDEGSGRS